MGKRRAKGQQAAQQSEGKGEATRTEAKPGGTDSKAETHTAAQGSVAQEQQAQQNAQQLEGGNVSALSGVGELELSASLACVRDRLMKRDDWQYISRLAKEMRSECNRARMTKEAREVYVWTELDRLYPPLAKTTCVSLLENSNSVTGKDLDQSTPSKVGQDSGRVQGLGDLPPGWPELPANASLAAEIGWVQANRLYVVEEQANGGTRVRLDQAHEPAPSRAAIGWLETSIRSYAKYVEVAAKATSTAQDEQAQVRAERVVMDEIRALLAEMV